MIVEPDNSNAPSMTSNSSHSRSHTSSRSVSLEKAPASVSPDLMKGKRSSVVMLQVILERLAMRLRLATELDARAGDSAARLRQRKRQYTMKEQLVQLEELQREESRSRADFNVTRPNASSESIGTRSSQRHLRNMAPQSEKSDTASDQLQHGSSNVAFEVERAAQLQFQRTQAHVGAIFANFRDISLDMKERLHAALESANKQRIAVAQRISYLMSHILEDIEIAKTEAVNVDTAVLPTLKHRVDEFKQQQEQLAQLRADIRRLRNEIHLATSQVEHITQEHGKLQIEAARTMLSLKTRVEDQRMRGARLRNEFSAAAEADLAAETSALMKRQELMKAKIAALGDAQVQDSVAHSAVVDLLSRRLAEAREELHRWQERSNTEITRDESELARLITLRKNLFQQLTEERERLGNEKQARIDRDSSAREAKEKGLLRARAALTIQSFWRGFLVRKQLGLVGKKKSKGKKTKGKSKKKGKGKSKKKAK